MVAVAPSVSTCEPFTTAEALIGCHSGDAEHPEETIELMIQAASDFLYEKLGRQFSGVCSTTAAACPSCGCGWGWGWFGNAWTWWPLGRSGWGSCRCGPYPALDLGPDPVVEVVNVKYEGVALNPATYRVDNWRYLVRLTDADGDNPGWPGPVNLSAPIDGEHSLTVTWRHGIEIPPLVGLAAIALSHQLLAACPGSAEECEMPPNVTQVIRQGATLSLRDLTAALNASAPSVTGLPAVAMALDAYNPEGTLPAVITDPDAERTVYPT